jgi:hypothetical protein
MTVEKRVERLERQNRWMKRLVAVTLAVAAAVLLVAQKKPPAEVIEAKRFVLRDDKGRGRAALGPHEHGVTLGMFDRDEKTGLMLGVWGTPFLVFRDARGETLELGQKEDGTIDLRLHDKLTLHLIGRKADLVIAGPDGKEIWKASDEMR